MANGKKAAPAKRGEVIDVGENLELVETRDDGGLIAQFTGNLRAFFMQARTLELQATTRLEQAKQLTLPKDADQDVFLQTFVKDANAHRKEIAEHWEICSVIHRFHRRLTSARDRGIGADEQAATLANTLHNRYVEEQNRRAREEQERRRREAEERERADRAQQQQALEQQALEAEANSPELSERERAFVGYYLGGQRTAGNAAASAAQAGYKNADQIAVRLMGSQKIQHAIAAQREATLARQQAAAIQKAPIVVEHEEVKPEIKRAPGAVTRVTHSATMLDAAAFVDAFVEGRYGIPRDLIVAYVEGRGEAKLNSYARDLQQQIERWPGVRYNKKTQVV